MNSRGHAVKLSVYGQHHAPRERVHGTAWRRWPASYTSALLPFVVALQCGQALTTTLTNRPLWRRFTSDSWCWCNTFAIVAVRSKSDARFSAVQYASGPCLAVRCRQRDDVVARHAEINHAVTRRDSNEFLKIAVAHRRPDTLTSWVSASWSNTAARRISPGARDSSDTRR